MASRLVWLLAAALSVTIVRRTSSHGKAVACCLLVCCCSTGCADVLRKGLLMVWGGRHTCKVWFQHVLVCPMPAQAVPASRGLSAGSAALQMKHVGAVAAHETVTASCIGLAGCGAAAKAPCWRQNLCMQGNPSAAPAALSGARSLRDVVGLKVGRMDVQSLVPLLLGLSGQQHLMHKHLWADIISMLAKLPGSLHTGRIWPCWVCSCVCVGGCAGLMRPGSLP
jgi:hypothetical protein